MPRQLFQKDLGQCYRFYNPVCSIIDELMTDDNKNLFMQRNLQFLRMAHEDMFIYKKVMKRFKSAYENEEDVENEVSFN